VSLDKPESKRIMRTESYVLVSACRNEAGYIDGLIEAISTQTVRPVRWIIVDDGSTDDTAARAEAQVANVRFLQIVKMPSGRPRSFASQVYAAQHGYELLKDLSFDFIGFLDADIRVGPDYYSRLLSFFQADPHLGLCGGAVIDKYEDRLVNFRKGSEDFHVAGGVQFFRRQCFEQIGGYIPIEGGGQDTIADIMTMMNGWKLCVFPELQALHLRPDGFAKDRVFRRGIKWGRKFYLIGYDPVYYLGQCLRRTTSRPYILTSVAMLLGFIWAHCKTTPRPVTPEFVRFLRELQWRRMRQRCGL
jgi:glycosyltransferase involved in cell wall biosynthesis